MTTATLKAFYTESGAMLSREDVERNLMLLPGLLEHMLEEGDEAKLMKQDHESGLAEIVISATCPKNELEEIVKTALRNSHLVGTLICQPSASADAPTAHG